MIGKLLRLHGVNLASASTVGFGEEAQDRMILFNLLKQQEEREREQEEPDFNEQLHEVSQILRGDMTHNHSINISKLQNEINIPNEEEVAETGQLKTFTMASALRQIGGFGKF